MRGPVDKGGERNADKEPRGRRQRRRVRRRVPRQLHLQQRRVVRWRERVGAAPGAAGGQHGPRGVHPQPNAAEVPRERRHAHPDDREPVLHPAAGRGAHLRPEPAVHDPRVRERVRHMDLPGPLLHRPVHLPDLLLLHGLRVRGHPARVRGSLGGEVHLPRVRHVHARRAVRARLRAVVDDVHDDGVRDREPVRERDRVLRHPVRLQYVRLPWTALQ
mmetsp:Transcript_37495/g.84421  ORF Transcript_37495/g.84421 Transcript_37495/m.84421 type:complete len:217 (-) Transcript_37495:432-1082(-)